MEPLAWALLALLALQRAAAAGSGNASKPHILLFLMDDLGWYNVGWHNPDTITPNMNQLVQQGVELDGSYTFFYCAPTRSSIMSGRLPYHVNQLILSNWVRDWEMPEQMTSLPRKLKQAGYATHMVGKWHVGFQSAAHTPHGRGFDSFFGFFGGAQDKWTQASCVDYACNVPATGGSPSPPLVAAGWEGNNTVDLWCTDKPCSGRVGAGYTMGRNGQVVGDEAFYSDRMFAAEAVRIIDAHDPAVPLFFYVAFENPHTQLEAPDRYIEMYPECWRSDRCWYAAMVTYVDECVGNVTNALRRKGMYENTLVVLSADNGGPTYWAPAKQWSGYPHGGGANNWPLKGSKGSNWEGGVRGASFVSGGFLPQAVRGTKLTEKFHVTDWYATFCFLAGVDPIDPNTVGVRSDGSTFPLPPVDSLNLWPLISGAVAASPRTEIPLVVHHPLARTSALIVGDMKLLLGTQQLSFWQGPAFPNGTDAEPYGADRGPLYDCGNDQTYEGGCLFNITADPHETTDLAQQSPDALASLLARLKQLSATALDQSGPAANQDAPVDPAYLAAVRKYGGFVGPWLPASAPPCSASGTCTATWWPLTIFVSLAQRGQTLGVLAAIALLGTVLRLTR